MKLMRYGAKGAEKPALVDAQQRVGDLEVGEGPQAEDAVGHEGGVARAQQRLPQWSNMLGFAARAVAEPSV